MRVHIHVYVRATYYNNNGGQRLWLSAQPPSYLRELHHLYLSVIAVRHSLRSKVPHTFRSGGEKGEGRNETTRTLEPAANPQRGILAGREESLMQQLAVEARLSCGSNPADRIYIKCKSDDARRSCWKSPTRFLRLFPPRGKPRRLSRRSLGRQWSKPSGATGPKPCRPGLVTNSIQRAGQCRRHTISRSRLDEIFEGVPWYTGASVPNVITVSLADRPSGRAGNCLLGQYPRYLYV